MTFGTPPSPRGRLRFSCGLIALFTVAITLLSAYARYEHWAGWAPNTFVTVQDHSVILGGIVAAALLAWLSFPLRDGAVRERIAVGVRSRGELTWHLWRLAFAFGIMIPIVAVAFALLASAPHTELSSQAFSFRLAMLWTVGSCAAVASIGMMGAQVGLVIGSRLALVVAPILAYLIVLLPLYTLGIGPWSGILAAPVASWIEAQPSLMNAGARAGVWLSILLCLAALLAGRRALGVVGVVGFGVSLSLAIYEGPTWDPVPQASEVICVGFDPAVCTRAPYERGLSEYEAIIREGLAIVPDLLRPTLVRTDHDIPAPDGGSALTVRSIGGTASPTNVPDRMQTLVVLGEELFVSQCALGADALGATAVFLGWSEQLGIPASDAHQPWQHGYDRYLPSNNLAVIRDALTSFARLNQSGFGEWLSEHAESIRACSLTPEEFG